MNTRRPFTEINLNIGLHPEQRLRISKVKVKFSLEQAPKAQRRSRGIALLFL
jgi:hypothetical protein